MFEVGWEGQREETKGRTYMKQCVALATQQALMRLPPHKKKGGLPPWLFL